MQCKSSRSLASKTLSTYWRKDQHWVKRGGEALHRYYAARTGVVISCQTWKRVHRLADMRVRPTHANETDSKVKGRWRYLYRLIDRDGNLGDVLLSEMRDRAAAPR